MHNRQRCGLPGWRRQQRTAMPLKDPTPPVPPTPTTSTPPIQTPTPSQRPPPPPVLRPLPAPVRWLLLAFAVLCLALGVVGIFVPGLPTTVFILLAAWAAARSSPRLHAWLWYHPLFGAMLRNWAQGGCVARRAKWSATVLMALCAVILWALSSRWWTAAVATGCMAVVLLWLWRRPEPR